MNDFSDLESQLKSLRPAPLRENFVARIEKAMITPEADKDPENIIRPVQFQRRWIAGLSLAAAAAVLLLIRVNFKTPAGDKRVASVSPVPTIAAPLETTQRQAIPNTLIPSGATQVVYHKRDEGLLFAQNSDQPMRRMRSITRETLQWRNPSTGASLRVSYPSEQIELIPVSGQ